MLRIRRSRLKISLKKFIFQGYLYKLTNPGWFIFGNQIKDKNAEISSNEKNGQGILYNILKHNALPDCISQKSKK